MTGTQPHFISHRTIEGWRELCSSWALYLFTKTYLQSPLKKITKTLYNKTFYKLILSTHLIFQKN